MVSRFESGQRQAEPKLPPVEVSINATELMNGIEGALSDNPITEHHIAGYYIEKRPSLDLPFVHNGMDVLVHIHRKRRAWTSRSMSVQIQYRDSEDPSIMHNYTLKMSCRRDKQKPELTRGVIKTNLDGVKNKNNQTAIQNAQRFKALLS